MATEIPEIELGLDEQQVGDEAVAALARCTDIFVRHGKLVHVVDHGGAGGGVEVIALPEALLRERLSRCARWREGEKAVRVPAWVVRAVAARGRWPGVQQLRAVVTNPVVAPDGSLVTRAGYDRATATYLAPVAGPVRARPRPSAAEVRRALVELRSAAESLGIVDESSLAGWIALLMTAQARFAIGGATPLFVLGRPGSALGLDLATATGAIVHATPLVAVDCEAMARRPDAVLGMVREDAGLTRIDRFTSSDTLTRARVLDLLQTDRRARGTVWVATVPASVLPSEVRSRVVYLDAQPPAPLGGFASGAKLIERSRVYRRALTILLAHTRDWGPSDVDDLSFASWGARVEDALVSVDLPRVLSIPAPESTGEVAPQSVVFDTIERMTEPATVRALLAKVRSPRDAGDRALGAAIEALEPGLLGHPRASQRFGFLLARLASEPLRDRALVRLGSGMHGNRWTVRVQP